MMYNNVWKLAVDCRPQYYILHPWRFVLDVSLGIKWSFQRATRGYANPDWWNMYGWFITVLPLMFDDYAENHFGYPGEEAGFTDEQWTTYLREIAQHLRNASEDQTVFVNEYRTCFDAMSASRRHGVHTCKDESGMTHTVWPDLSDEQKEISDKYFQREAEIYHFQCDEAARAFDMIGKQFFSLWD